MTQTIIRAIQRTKLIHNGKTVLFFTQRRSTIHKLVFPSFEGSKSAHILKLKFQIKRFSHACHQLISSANQHGAFVLDFELQLHRLPQHIIPSLSESVTCCTADLGLEPRKVKPRSSADKKFQQRLVTVNIVTYATVRTAFL